MVDIEEGVYRILGAVIVIGAILAMGPLLISQSTAPVCNFGNFNSTLNGCQYFLAPNQTCISGWTSFGTYCGQAAKYNDAFSQFIILIAIAIVFIAGFVYIFREKKYS